MFSFIARALGLFSLAITLATAVMDITKSIGASDIVWTSLGATWVNISITSIQAAQGAIQGYVHPFLWDPVIQWVLLWPTWLVFAVLAVILLLLGRPRHRKFGRFAKG
jgi:hypothetical protein